MNNLGFIFFGLVLSVGLNASAQVFLRNGVKNKILSFNFDVLLEIVKSVQVWYGMVCYAISIFLWIFVLSKIQVFGLSFSSIWLHIRINFSLVFS